MASLRERAGRYYIVFTRRINGDLNQKVVSLKTQDKGRAERLKFDLEEQYARGVIDPFGAWDISRELERRRRRSRAGTTLASIAEPFLSSQSHVQPVTLDNYRQRLERLTTAIGPTMPVRLIEPDDIRSFCFKPRFSNATKRTYLRFCRKLFKWMVSEGYVDESVAAAVAYPKKKDNISDKTITEGQLKELHAAHKEVQRPKIRQGRCRGLHTWFKPLTALGFYTGLRRGELVKLTWDKVAIEDGFIEVTDTKPGRERVVPIQQNLMPYLRAWHRLCGRPSRGLVFRKKGVGNRQIPLNKNHVTQVFKKYVRAADLPDTVHLHGLRHACATHLLRKGMGINEVAKILGHSSLEVTQIYEHLNPTDLQKCMRELGL